MSKELMAKWDAWVETVHLHEDGKPFTANDPEYALSMAAFYAGYNLRDDEAEAEQSASATPAGKPDDTDVNEMLAESDSLGDALFTIADKYGAQVTNNEPRWQDGHYLRHMGDFIRDVQEAFKRHEAGWGRVEWGVQVGTWPPTEYQNRAIAEHRAANPFVSEKEYPHTLVTRTQYNTPWVKVQS